jgi:hypothetical protein
MGIGKTYENLQIVVRKSRHIGQQRGAITLTDHQMHRLRPRSIIVLIEEPVEFELPKKIE